jgi:hypothetical protein
MVEREHEKAALGLQTNICHLCGYNCAKKNDTAPRRDFNMDYYREVASDYYKAKALFRARAKLPIIVPKNGRKAPFDDLPAAGFSD